MYKIAFDIMGNDNGVKAGVEAVLDFTNKNLNYTFILVGDKNQINKYTKETERIKIIDVPNVVDKDSDVRMARRDDNSMAAAIKLVANEKADVVISSGNSAVYLSMATLILKRLKNIKRPAFMPVFPTIKPGKRFVLLDAGANLEVTNEMLTQWANLGQIFTQIVLKQKNPRVGLLNIGTEESKGKVVQQEAHQKLKQNVNINYTGFVEARNLLEAAVDVAVVDGYGGNMILKSMEGAILAILKLLKNSIKSKLKYKIGYAISQGAFKNVKDTLDYRNVGSAWLIGLNGLAIKCHGGADKQSYLGAFNQIDESLSNDILAKLKEVLYE